MSLKLDDVGSGSHRTNIGGYYNTALTPGPGDPQTRAPNPYGIPTLYDHGVGSSQYNALQVSLDKRYTNGLVFQVAYTWSQSFTADDGWFNSEGLTVQDAYNPKASRGYAGTNVPQAIAINTIYDIPVGPGRRFSTGNRFGDYILGNWQINNIFTGRSGQNQTVVDSADVANIGNPNVYERANMVGNPFSGFTRSKNEWFNTAAFAIPAQYTFGNAYRGLIQGQRFINFDTSVIRSFPLCGEISSNFALKLSTFSTIQSSVSMSTTAPISIVRAPSERSTVNRKPETLIENCKLAARLFSKKCKRTTRPKPLRGGRVFYRKEDQEGTTSQMRSASIRAGARVKALWAFLFACAILLIINGAAKSDSVPTYAAESNDGYIGSQACSECHLDIYQRFTKTSMGRSMSKVTPAFLKPHFFPRVLQSKARSDFSGLSQEGKL